MCEKNTKKKGKDVWVPRPECSFVCASFVFDGLIVWIVDLLKKNVCVSAESSLLEKAGCGVAWRGVAENGLEKPKDEEIEDR